MKGDDWRACTDMDSLYQELRICLSDRKLRLFAAACLRRVWDLLGNEATRLAVEVSEQYADSLVRRDELVDVWTNAELDSGEGLWIAPPNAQGCHCQECLNLKFPGGREAYGRILVAVRDAEASPAWTAARAVLHARELVSWSAGRESREAAVEQERRGQYTLLLDILRPFRSPAIAAAWLTWNERTIPKLARTIYNTRAFNRLPILSDALEEAGCTDPDILTHCRRPGEHVRGCWLLDAVLGKE
jgi:hypothetical protein